MNIKYKKYSLFIIYLLIVFILFFMIFKSIKFLQRNNRTVITKKYLFNIKNEISSYFVFVQESLLKLSDNLTVREYLLKKNKEKKDVRLVLKLYKEILNASIIYIMDRNGDVIASSFYNKKYRLTGNNYGFRKYFTEALQGKKGIYSAVGITTQERGFYFSNKIEYNNKIIGIIVIKMNLSRIDSLLRKCDDVLMLNSPDGIIFSTNKNSFLFSAFKPLSKQKLNELERTKQFANNKINILNWKIKNQLLELNGEKYHLFKEKIIIPGWELIALCNIDLITPVNNMQLFILVIISLFLFLFVTIITLLIFNIDRRKIMEKALIDSEKKIKAIFNHTFQYIGLMDKEGVLLETNDSSLKLVGVEEKDVIGKKLWDTPWWSHSKKMQTRLKKSIKKAAKGKFVRFEATHYNQDGNLVLVDFSLQPVKDEDDKIIMIIPEGRDITALKETEMELIKTKSYLDSIIDSMPSAIIGIDQKETIINVNKQAEIIAEKSRSRIIGRNFFTIFPFCRDIDIYSSNASENRILINKNKKEKHFNVTAYPLSRKNRKGIIIRIEDVTKKVFFNETMIQSEKMMSLGGLAAGMAHEINNPLSIITQGIQLIRHRVSGEVKTNEKIASDLNIDLRDIRKYLSESNITEYLKGMHEASMRAAAIISDMIAFSTKRYFKKERVNINFLLNKTIDIASKDYDLKKKYDFKNVIIFKKYDYTIPLIQCFPVEIEQVILNILRNAAQAMSEIKKENYLPAIEIVTKFRNNFLSIEIADNGPGINRNIVKNIFEPFFSTKNPGMGTGLGLSVSYFIITKNHNGEISVKSAPGKGARFIIKLPV